MDLAYYSYLAQTIPKKELARAVAARARKALRNGVKLFLEKSGAAPFFFDVPDEVRRQRTLHALVGTRPALIAASDREETAALLHQRWPEACAFVLREAEACLRGELPIFGKWKDCSKAGGGIDYARDPLVPSVIYDVRKPGHQVNLFVPGADAKAAWEVGRLQHLWRLAQARWLTGEARWTRAWVETVRQFHRDCPAGHGVQWSCAMEVAVRAMNVAMTFAYVYDDAAVDARFVGELLDLLEEHCLYVEEHLEDTGAIRTNHYAADLVGLVVVGALFPELHRSRVWLRQYGKQLWAEIEAQVRPDGTHFESSTGYQRLTAELFLAAVLAARAAGAPAPVSVERAVVGMFRSIADVLKPNGEIPQIGDLDSCRGLPLMPRAALDCGYLPALGAAALGDPELRIEGAPCPVEVAWLLGPAAVRRFEKLPALARTGSVALKPAGIATLRSAGMWLCMSAGPNGQGGTGGHAHNDKNSVELAFGDASVVCDRGTYVYARDPRERNARRSTAGHSTVQVDGREQNRIVPGRLFALPDTAQARIVTVESRDGIEVAIGEHHGFPGFVHRRTAGLHAKARGAAFMDELHGDGEHRFDLRWFVPHAAALQREATAEERARFEQLHDAGLSFGYDFTRCVEIPDVALFAFGATLAWTLAVSDTDVSPGYAEKLPAKELRLSLKGNAPARLFTAVLNLK